MNINKLTIQSIEAQAKSLLDMARHDNNDYEAVVNLIMSCKGKLVFTGMGKSGIIARKLSATYSSTGVASFFVHPGEAYHGDLGMIEENDVIFAFSNSGETPELINLLKFSRTKAIIAVSQSKDSPIGEYATVHLECKVDKEICPLNLAPTTSTTAALVMGDAICASIMERSKFSEKDFAQFHPGGTLGKNLLTKAHDIMNTKVPFVQKSDTLHEILLKVSEGRLGLACVGDAANVEGVITDGDLRRAIASSDKPNSLTAEQIATTKPVFLQENAGLAEMHAVFQERKIVSILIGSSTNLKGVVQFYDLHKM
ncbi:MAG: KpsF/GutQ family sugar-phosphate isomerase [Bacteroidota bacterium]|nr:KpsF/GutQ family sugar-phosphate isomerase [Bacteroidota bacterium]